jgi:hypothetical protein
MRCSRVAEERAWTRLGIRCEHFPVGSVIQNYAKSAGAFRTRATAAKKPPDRGQAAQHQRGQLIGVAKRYHFSSKFVFERNEA